MWSMYLKKKKNKEKEGRYKKILGKFKSYIENLYIIIQLTSKIFLIQSLYCRIITVNRNDKLTKNQEKN